MGDSGQKGSVASWRMAGTAVRASSQGQPSSVPSTLFMPSTWEMRMLRVMISWYTVPSCNTDHVKISAHSCSCATHRASERHGRDLRKVHGGEAGVEAGVDADHEAAGDQHLEAVGGLGEAHQQGGHHHQHVVEEEAALAPEPAGHHAHQGAAHHAADAEDRHDPGPDQRRVPVAGGSRARRGLLVKLRGIIANLKFQPFGHDLRILLVKDDEIL